MNQGRINFSSGLIHTFVVVLATWEPASAQTFEPTLSPSIHKFGNESIPPGLRTYP